MLAAPPAILESGVFMNIPLWVIGAFFGAALVLILTALFITYLFSPAEESERSFKRVETKKESPQRVLEDFKRKYGVSTEDNEGVTWYTVLIGLLVLIFLIIGGFLLGSYMEEGESSGKAFVPYVRESIIQPMLQNISSRLNPGK